MNINKRYVKMGITVGILVLIDQIIKAIVGYCNGSIIIQNFLKLTVVENTGGAFGIVSNSPFFLILTSTLVLGIITKFIISQKDRIDNKTLVALSLVLAGGLSNLIDRIYKGFVLDYLDIRDLINFPVFNIADIYVTIGVIMLLVLISIYTIKEVKIKK